jgi:hypothetical protein
MPAGACASTASTERPSAQAKVKRCPIASSNSSWVGIVRKHAPGSYSLCDVFLSRLVLPAVASHFDT